MSKGPSRTLSTQEANDLLNSRSGKQEYKMQGHSLTPLRNTGKYYCSRCGLVALNNKLSEWCIDKGCNYMDHNQYQSTVYRLTKMEIK